MAHPDCPTLRDIAAADLAHAEKRHSKHQRENDKTEKYYAQAMASGQGLIAICWSDKIHPLAPPPSFDMSCPMALIRGDAAPDLDFWSTLPKPKQLRAAVAAAIERMDLSPWPS